MAFTAGKFVSLALVVLSLRCALAEFVPDEIKVPSGYKLHLVLSAEGDQYYRYNGTSWVNFNATAKLRDWESKKVVGRHYYLAQPDPLWGQPTWETLKCKGVPASLVTGVAVARVTVDEDSIPWVLLKATNNSGSKKYLGDVEYILRFNTANGLAPSSTSGAREGDVRTSSYTADYAFYIPE
jgi:hypothetical protein